MSHSACEVEDYRRLVEDTLPIVREVSRTALALQQRTINVKFKADGSPVTQADHAIEEFLFDELGRLTPDDGFKGEENRTRASSSGREWIVDPIDGTVQFIRGQEFWSILMGLEDQKVGKVGIISFPARNELIYASTGNGCWEETSGSVKKLEVSDTHELSRAYILHNGIEFARRVKRAKRLSVLLSSVGAERGYADAFGHMEVARGHSDCMIDFMTEHHDIAAVRVAIEEAGGHWSTLSGGQELGQEDAGSITTNGILHEIIREMLEREDPDTLE